MGRPGISASCLDAVLRLVQYEGRVEHAKLLTADGSHCLLLVLEGEEYVGVKSGFSSGYSGEGPRTLANVLRVLHACGAEIEEYKVSKTLLERIDASALSDSNLDFINSCDAVRPRRWQDYVYDAGYQLYTDHSVWKLFRLAMPWAILDARLCDLALEFFDDPDRSILNAFRRLEDILRKRINSDASGTRLFSAAFNGEDSLLTWTDIELGEQKGRGQLFTGAYMAYRNPRAHKESLQVGRAALAEFLLINQLYLLEQEAIARPSGKVEQS